MENENLRCCKCNEILDDTDIEFLRRLNKKGLADDCICACCITGGNQSRKDTKEKLKKYIVAKDNIACHFAFMFCLFIIMAIFRLYQFSAPDNNIIRILPLVVFALIAMGAPISIVKSWYKEEDYYEDEHYRGQFESNNTLRIEHVQGSWRKRDNTWWLIICFITYISWWEIHLIYLLVKTHKMKKEIPATYLKAYYAAQSTIEVKKLSRK